MMRLVLLLAPLLLLSCSSPTEPAKPRVIVSTDIGGSDPDDYQSMVHLLLYADRLDLEGLISSPPHQGRKRHIEEVLDAYEQDYPVLTRSSSAYPAPGALRAITKQGVIDVQPGPVPDTLSDGARWILQQARADDPRPLYILVWGSITDVAQAVHAIPAIKDRIRIYSIGSWNTRMDSLSRNYLYDHHADLWWIENNTTFRGMYMGGDQAGAYGNASFVEQHVAPYGALGALFAAKKGDIKMGDTPSVLYLLSGDPDDPTSASWGGSFVRTTHGPQYWTDNPADSLAEQGRPGARTVNRFRKAYLNDWKERMHVLANEP